MYARLVLLLTSSLRPLFVSGLLACLFVVLSDGQTKRPQTSGNGAMRERIATIIRGRLKEGATVIKGVRVQTRTPPSPKAVEEIKGYGDAAIPILADYLRSKNDRERAIAVEFLGLLGGRGIIEPLQGVIRHDASPTVRILALRWIMQAPWDLASPIIREASATDADQSVRAEAQSILNTYGAK